MKKQTLEQLKGRLWFHQQMGNTGMIAILTAKIEKMENEIKTPKK